MVELTIKALLKAAADFAPLQATHSEPSLFGRNDGKAVGTYLEGRFVSFLLERYQFSTGNAALGIDLPSLNVDIKTTSKRQPQSSCPYRSARQKVYGLGYGLLVFVYEKTDNARKESAILKIAHTVFIESEHTADYQLTATIADYLARGATDEDLAALFMDRNLPLDEIGATQLAQEVLAKPPKQGYLTISNAQQWRLQYGHALKKAGQVQGVMRIT
jgi:hypothetical protein